MGKRRHSGTSKAAIRERNERFVKAYLAKGENATEAYLAIKPDVARNSAATEGYKLLKLPEIQRAIEQYRAEQRQRFALTADRVLEELARVAYFTPKRLVDEQGKPIPLHRLDDATASALAAIEIEARGDGAQVTRWRPHNKTDAIEKAAKILRLYDKPPPPPPADDGELAEDPRETARRLAFLLAQEAAAREKEQKRAAPKAKKKLTLAA